MAILSRWQQGGVAGLFSVNSPRRVKYSPNEAREHGRWTSGGGSAVQDTELRVAEHDKTKPTKEEFGHYANFTLNALAGRNPDEYYADHKDAIDKSAAFLQKKLGPKEGSTIYRGIILDPSEVHDGVVKAVPKIQFVSFSDDKKIALAFADTDNPMAAFMRQRFPDKKGYLITQSYEPKDLLYHHSWASAIHLDEAFGDDAQYTKMQKEVMLKPQDEYKVTPVKPGVSHGEVVGKSIILKAAHDVSDEPREHGRWVANGGDSGTEYRMAAGGAAKERRSALKLAKDQLAAASSITDEHKQLYGDTIKKVIGRMNDNCVKRLDANLTSYQFFNSNQEITDIAVKTDPEAKAYIDAHPGAVTEGAYNPNEKWVQFDGATGDEDQPSDTYAHEYYHAIDGPKSELSNDDAWLSAGNKELTKGQLSDYGATSASEGFAEFGRFLCSDMMNKAAKREKFEHDFPLCFKYFKDHDLLPKVFTKKAKGDKAWDDGSDDAPPRELFTDCVIGADGTIYDMRDPAKIGKPQAAAAPWNKDFDESKHPRDAHGRFGSGGTKDEDDALKHGQDDEDKKPPLTRGWHLTDDPHFKPDPNFKPTLNSLFGDAVGDNRPAGIFVGNPEYWMHAHGYERPYVAEIEGRVTNPTMTQYYPGQEQFMQGDDMRTVRVLTADEYARETYHEPGWVETWFGDAPKNPNQEGAIFERPYKFPENYVARSVSDMSPAEIKEWERRFNQYASRPDGPNPAPKKDGRWIIKDFDPDKHPRDDRGRFGNGESESVAPAPVYQGTTKKIALDKILTQGLKRGDEWQDRKPSVYCTSDINRAVKYAIMRGGAGYGAVVEFDPPKKAKIIDDELDDKQAYRIEQDVPPERIRAVYFLTKDGQLGEKHANPSYKGEKAAHDKLYSWVKLDYPEEKSSSRWIKAAHDISEEPRDHGRWTAGGGDAWIADAKVPAEPGTTPIPKDHVRLYHYTEMESHGVTPAGKDGSYTVEQVHQVAEKLKREGLDISKAKGSTYGEPDVVWASTEKPNDGKLYAEFSVPIDDPRWQVGKPSPGDDPREYESRKWDSYFSGSIKPEEIIAVHEPWQHQYRDIVNDPDGVASVLRGDHDWVLKDNSPYHEDFKAAVLKIKADYGKDKPKEKASRWIKAGHDVSGEAREHGRFAVTEGAGDGKEPKTQTAKEHVIRSAKFKSWFGDWENDLEHSSKVVDKEGKPQETSTLSHVRGPDDEPIAVYHGTEHGGFNQFDKSKLSDTLLYGKGFYFTEGKEIAEAYASGKWQHNVRAENDVVVEEDRADKNAPATQKGEVKELFLNIRHPFDLDQPMPVDDLEKLVKHLDAEHGEGIHPDEKVSDVLFGRAYAADQGLPEAPFAQAYAGQLCAAIMQKFPRTGSQKITDILTKAGYDGTVHKDVWVPGKGRLNDKDYRTWVAFEATQIKATDAKDFDPHDPNIHKDFDPDKHPRDDHGRFGSGSGGEAQEHWKAMGVKSPEFKAWFGDWQSNPSKASKVVDSDGAPAKNTAIKGASVVVDGQGKPEIVYHGTRSPLDFTEFVFPKDANPDRMIGPHFATDENVSDTFTKPENAYPYSGAIGSIKPVYLNIRNPLIVDQAPEGHERVKTDEVAIGEDLINRTMPNDRETFVKWASRSRAISDEQAGEVFDKLSKDRKLADGDPAGPFDASRYPKLHPVAAFVNDYDNHLIMLPDADKANLVNRYRDALEKAGYDGIRYVNTSPVETEHAKDRTCWIVLRPNQIKSATGNSGTFDPNSPDITKSLHACHDCWALIEAAEGGSCSKCVGTSKMRRKSLGQDHSAEFAYLWPPVPQETNFECGAASTKWAVDGFGVGGESLKKVADDLGTTAEKSTSPQAIIDYLRGKGLDVLDQQNMTVDDLARAAAEGKVVICPCQDYVSQQGKAENSKALWNYGHYMTFHKIVGDAPYRVLWFHDSSMGNMEREPGGDVPKQDIDTEKVLEIPGLRTILESAWNDAWHDIGEPKADGTPGTKYIHYGIIVAPPELLIGHIDDGDRGFSKAFNPDQQRDDHGRFASVGGTMARGEAIHDPTVFWHGSPSGELVGGSQGLHLGTHEAAKEALQARIGVPAEGEWDGTREYGKTLLAGKKRLLEIDPKGYNQTGYNCRHEDGTDVPDENYYPRGDATYSDGSKISLTAKPSIEPYKIVGEMKNTPKKPISDESANRRGGKLTTHGYYYRNEGEDAGSISVVVPNGGHLEKIKLSDVGTKDFDPEKHPKDEHGRWTSGSPQSTIEGDDAWALDKQGALEAFHGTVKKYIASIRKEGIVITKKPGADEWAVQHFGTTNTRKPSVYVAVDADFAGQIAMHAKELTGSIPVVFEVKVPKEKIDAFKIDESTNPNGAALRYEGTIPPDWIVGYRELKAMSSDGIGNFGPMHRFRHTHKAADQDKIVHVLVCFKPDDDTKHARWLKAAHDVSDEARGEHGRWATSASPKEDEEKNIARLEGEYQTVKPDLEKVIKEAEFRGETVEGPPSSWDDLSSSQQEATANEYVESHLSEEVNYQAENYDNSDYFKEEAENDDEWKNEAFDEWLDSAGIDPDSVEEVARNPDQKPLPGFTSADIVPTGVTLGTKTDIDPSKLRWAEGGQEKWHDAEGKQPGDILSDLQDDWDETYDKAMDKQIDKLADDFASNPPDWVAASAQESLEESFATMADSEKLEYAVSSGNVSDDDDSSQRTVQEPSKYEPFNGDDEYEKTRSVALFLQMERAQHYWDERGCTPKPFDPASYSKKIWAAWKGSSTSNVGLALQEATAEELGGKLRFTASQKERAAAGFARMGGKEAMKAYVRATWEASQFVLDKAGMKEVPTYRAIWYPTDEIVSKGHPEEDHFSGAPNQYGVPSGSRYTKLPGLQLLRNGAQSTTMKRLTANSWNGIGEKPDNSERVVVRMECPREAIVSLPCFGQNVTEEQEVVVAGTRWNKWDVWRGEAPRIEDVPIKMARWIVKAVSYDGTIDFTAMDEGQPHWLNTKARAAAAKLNRPKPRSKRSRWIVPKGGPGSGNFGHSGRPGSVGGSGEGVQGGTSRENVAMVSPYEHDPELTVEQAENGLKSERQKALMEQFDKVDKDLLGLKTKQTAALGAWPSGAENSTETEYPKDTPFADMRLSAIMKGRLANQKQVLVFKAGEGEQVLHEVHVAETDMGKLHDMLDKEGVPYHTLVPEAGGSRIVVYSTDKDTDNHVADFAENHDGRLESHAGTGELIPNPVVSREDSQRQYDRQIGELAGARSDGTRLLGAWEEHRDHWYANPVKRFGRWLIGGSGGDYNRATDNRSAATPPRWLIPRAGLFTKNSQSLSRWVKGNPDQPRGQPGNAGQFASVSHAATPSETAREDNRRKHGDNAEAIAAAEKDWKEHGTDAKAFKEWFGDSKVVDADGKPMIVYHGTKADFHEFNRDHLGDVSSIAAPGVRDTWLGFMFAEDKNRASFYASRTGDGQPNVKPVYLAINNPVECKDTEAVTKLRQKDIDGHDGVHVASTSTWIAFEPTQIKSASGNRGTFDSEDPDIRKSSRWYRVKTAVEDEARDEHGRWTAGGSSAVRKPQAAASVIFHDGKVLILKRGDTAPWMPGKWNLPGGGVDPGEDHETAAKREAHEESGIKLDNVEKVHAAAHDDYEAQFFVGHADSDKVQRDSENVDHAWITRADLDKYDFVPDVKDAIEKAFDHEAAKSSQLGKVDKDPAVQKAKEDALTQIGVIEQNAKDTSSDPATKAAYESLKKQVWQQYQDILAKGYTFEFSNHDPYKTSKDMRADVDKRKTLVVYNESNDLPKDHPLAEIAQNGETYNSVFRGVHDMNGHYFPGNSFGPNGELGAYQAHSKMFTEDAYPALAAETLAQNAWVNAGPHHPEKLQPKDRPFAPQKAYAFPMDIAKDMAHAKYDDAVKALGGTKAASRWIKGNPNHDEHGKFTSADDADALKSEAKSREFNAVDVDALLALPESKRDAPAAGMISPAGKMLNIPLTHAMSSGGSRGLEEAKALGFIRIRGDSVEVGKKPSDEQHDAIEKWADACLKSGNSHIDVVCDNTVDAIKDDTGVPVSDYSNEDYKVKFDTAKSSAEALNQIDEFYEKHNVTQTDSGVDVDAARRRLFGMASSTSRWIKATDKPEDDEDYRRPGHERPKEPQPEHPQIEPTEPPKEKASRWTKAGSDDEARDSHGRWTSGGESPTVPESVRGTLFSQGLDPQHYHEHAVAMMAALDKSHADDPSWSKNVAAVKNAMSGFPMIHTAQLGNIQDIEKTGLRPAHEFNAGLEFDKISGLDRTVFMRMGQAGGGGHGAVGAMIDPTKLDPDKFIVTKLGAMTLKQDQEAMLKTPGDHSALVASELKPYRDSTIDYQSLADVQSRLLVAGYMKDHPEAVGHDIPVTTVIANDHGEMEVKYADRIPPEAIIAYFAGDKPLDKFGNVSAYDYLKGKIPDSKLVKYDGDGLKELSAAYRAHYAKSIIPRDDYAATFMANIEKSSRSAHGVSDTTASAAKPKADVEGEKLAAQVKENTKAAFDLAYETAIGKPLDTGDKVRAFVEKMNDTVQAGIAPKDGSKWRTWDVSKFGYTPPDKVHEELDRFCAELAKRMTAGEDPIKTAAWSEQQFDTRIHAFADGMGRTSKALSAMILMRANAPLPDYAPRDEYYRHAHDSGADWEMFYRSMFPADKSPAQKASRWLRKDWEEDKHPRDHGKFASKEGDEGKSGSESGSKSESSIKGTLRTPTPELTKPIDGLFDFEGRCEKAGVGKIVVRDETTDGQLAAMATELTRAKEVFPDFNIGLVTFGGDTHSREVERKDGPARIEMGSKDAVPMYKVAQELESQVRSAYSALGSGNQDYIKANFPALADEDIAELSQHLNERQALAENLKGRKYDEWNPVHTAYIDGGDALGPALRHEIGHRLHAMYDREIGKLTGLDYYKEQFGFNPEDEGMKAAFQAKSMEYAKKYGITQRGRDNFGEAVAENFSAYLAGFDDKVQPDLLKLFKELSARGRK